MVSGCVPHYCTSPVRLHTGDDDEATPAVREICTQTSPQCTATDLTDSPPVDYLSVNLATHVEKHELQRHEDARDASTHSCASDAVEERSTDLESISAEAAEQELEEEKALTTATSVGNESACVRVHGIDSQDGQLGRQFFFDPTEWHDMSGTTSSSMWRNKMFAVVQLRAGNPIWRGQVIVKRSGASCFGKRAHDADWGQWEVGDEIAQGCSDTHFADNAEKDESMPAYPTLSASAAVDRTEVVLVPTCIAEEPPANAYAGAEDECASPTVSTIVPTPTMDVGAQDTYAPLKTTEIVRMAAMADGSFMFGTQDLLQAPTREVLNVEQPFPGAARFGTCDTQDLEKRSDAELRTAETEAHVSYDAIKTQELHESPVAVRIQEMPQNTESEVPTQELPESLHSHEITDAAGQQHNECQAQLRNCTDEFERRNRHSEDARTRPDILASEPSPLSREVGKASRPMWSADFAYSLGHTVDDHENAYQFLDAEAYPSVQKAVDALNAGTVSCPDGICIVRSERQKLYFIVARSDKRDNCAAIAWKGLNIRNAEQPFPGDSQRSPTSETLADSVRAHEHTAIAGYAHDFVSSGEQANAPTNDGRAVLPEAVTMPMEALESSQAHPCGLTLPIDSGRSNVSFGPRAKATTTPMEASESSEARPRAVTLPIDIRRAREHPEDQLGIGSSASAGQKIPQWKGFPTGNTTQAARDTLEHPPKCELASHPAFRRAETTYENWPGSNREIVVETQQKDEGVKPIPEAASWRVKNRNNVARDGSSKLDERFDFGKGLARCSVCNSLPRLNRGCQVCSVRICRRCFANHTCGLASAHELPNEDARSTPVVFV